jgi:ferric-dicitrate binding protein FerR (iron transport regulator)
MSDEIRAREELAVLDSALSAEPEFEVSPARRSQTLAALTRLARPAPRRRPILLGGLALALAAGVALALGARALSVKPVNPATVVTTFTGQREKSPGGVDILFTRGGRAGLTELAGAGSTSLRLLTGSVEIQVPKQRPGESFAVLTPDARVVVHGTRFSVEVMALPSGPRSCVKVQEGLVSVVRGAESELLGPGATSGCAAAAKPSAEAASAAVTASASERASTAPSVANPRPARERRPATLSALADANRLLSRGLELERAGQLRAAEQAFSQLLERYPDSAIAPEAQSALERVRRAR